MNSYNCTGHLTDNPARRVTTTTTTTGVVAVFRVAVDGKPKRLWINVEAWGHLAGKVATYLTAGRHVAITGRLVQDEYIDRSGHRQTRYKVVAATIDFLDASNDTRESDDTNGHAAAGHDEPAPTPVGEPI